MIMIPWFSRFSGTLVRVDVARGFPRARLAMNLLVSYIAAQLVLSVRSCPPCGSGRLYLRQTGTPLRYILD